MKRSVSAPSLAPHVPSNPMRRSVTTHAFPIVELNNVVDVAIATNAPIQTAALCAIEHNFPSQLIDKSFARCMITPCDPPENPSPSHIRNFLQRSYLQLAMDEGKWCDKYNVWMTRVRKMKKNDK